jgi:hypothetical protein
MRCVLMAGLAAPLALLNASGFGAPWQAAAAEAPTTATSEPSGRDLASRARSAAEAELRQLSPVPNAVRLRRIGVFRQSARDTIAVCGQVSLTGADSAFADFVAVVITPESGEAPRVRELHLAERPGNAARTAAEGFLRCSDESKHLDATTGTDLRSGSPPPMSGPPRSEAQAAPPDSMVVVRQSGNLRAGPDTGSAVIRVVPRGSVVRIFRTAPGGWYQIGDTAPWGWMHSSLLFGP